MSLPPFLAGAKTQFDVTEQADQDSLYLLAESLLALPYLDLADLKTDVLLPATPLKFKLTQLD